MLSRLFSMPAHHYALRFANNKRMVVNEDLDYFSNCWIHDPHTKALLWDTKKKALWAAQLYFDQSNGATKDLHELELVSLVEMEISGTKHYVECWHRKLIPEIDYD